MRFMVLGISAACALAACDGGTQGAGVTDDETTTEARAIAAGEGSPEETAAVTAARIPAGIQGRWGLTAADCEPGRAGATGLLTITGDKLEFYESVGRLGRVSEADEVSIRASFDFAGEGMTWTRDVLLDLQNDGRTLVRRDYGQDAAPEPITYARCR